MQENLIRGQLANINYYKRGTKCIKANGEPKDKNFCHV